MTQQRVHQFTTSGWFLIVMTFAIGYAIGRFDYQIQALMNLIIEWLGGGVYCFAAPC